MEHVDGIASGLYPDSSYYSIIVLPSSLFLANYKESQNWEPMFRVMYETVMWVVNTWVPNRTGKLMSRYLHLSPGGGNLLSRTFRSASAFSAKSTFRFQTSAPLGYKPDSHEATRKIPEHMVGSKTSSWTDFCQESLSRRAFSLLLCAVYVGISVIIDLSIARQATDDAFRFEPMCAVLLTEAWHFGLWEFQPSRLNMVGSVLSVPSRKPSSSLYRWAWLLVVPATCKIASPSSHRRSGRRHSMWTFPYRK